ncbi:hypothetical protein GGI25_001893 [Coemansia spiralis]|uniref:RRM domain-containing protein n=2 Tax=Coemansia TaxID=4863 RepID=A0A9W8GBJ6_9FUNG|nr:hypothetical protein BX070DRAFT_234885 [Coemansia spiralis]KAJ1993327.1 hypothetical protein EDC05_002191 [Coemansia umbellata]KAJ2623525.1 hypothetical protein GGI26_002364 [Coemansia sp. RSA 1358]KAJ2678904.1 hypothetical protein GGI25_001893 [Coemansia spiralis]
MTSNLDLALDDIIKSESRDQDSSHRNRNNRSNNGAGQRNRQGRNNRRDSPYSRNNDGSRRSDRGKWSHDLYEGPRSINARLKGDSASSINSRLGTPRDSPKTESPRLHRGIAIAGTSRDTSLYDSMRVVWATNLPHNYDLEKVKNIFSDVGRVDDVRMAIDSNGRFVGKAEVVYRIPDDARSAIQNFDGETLYTADAAGIKVMNVTYSSAENAAYIENLKFENSLPAPREIPMQMRLGGVAASTIAAMNMMSGQQMIPAQTAWSGYGQPGNRGGTNQRNSNSSQQRSWQGRRQQNSNNNNPQRTIEQLDADMDAYMKGGSENNGAVANNASGPESMETTTIEPASNVNNDNNNPT